MIFTFLALKAITLKAIILLAVFLFFAVFHREILSLTGLLGYWLYCKITGMKYDLPKIIDKKFKTLDELKEYLEREKEEDDT